ncbi:hypothetical protein IWQ62_000414 [Dispira parvispora]|uniref:Peptidase S1 domain-containing protein n=1 Tax=Dispira parvispora TaxID=1520584 RepID=A0A9W8EA67_9FUNG|nr:hypothetical protein IWQ62_000414 [Dispira parvispora]
MSRQWNILGYACMALCVVSTYAQPSALYPRILGGENATEGQVPFYGDIYMKNGPGNICGGSLIADEWFLTTASCLTNHGEGSNSTAIPIPAAEMAVVLGNANGKSPHNVDIAEVFHHEQYKVTGEMRIMENDIALVRLAEKVKLNDNINVVKIYSGKLQVNDSMMVAGKGIVDLQHLKISHTLQVVTLAVTEPAACRKAFDSYGDANGPLVCLGAQDGRDACPGDSGGPMYTVNANKQSALVGMTSAGATDEANAPACGGEGSVGIYTHIYHYIDWISEKTGIPKEQFLDNTQESGKTPTNMAEPSIESPQANDQTPTNSTAASIDSSPERQANRTVNA